VTFPSISTFALSMLKALSRVSLTVLDIEECHVSRMELDEFHGQVHPPHPFGLLNQIFNSGNGRHGDMVFSQEALDRVISQLMEQSNSSNAPPPASEEAIRSLEKKMVDKDMLGTGGKAECSICMDDVALNQEVTVLPCKHWFHGGCVTAWLKEHDTCPHCRKPIEAQSNRHP
jgi:E3 ubiquitin-protein ligase RNF115/126